MVMMMGLNGIEIFDGGCFRSIGSLVFVVFRVLGGFSSVCMGGDSAEDEHARIARFLLDIFLARESRRTYISPTDLLFLCPHNKIV